MGGSGNRSWRALSHRIFRRRTLQAGPKDKLDIGYALAYSTTQLVSTFQFSDQQNFTTSTIYVSAK